METSIPTTGMCIELSSTVQTIVPLGVVFYRIIMPIFLILQGLQLPVGLGQ
ncbi:MAG: hypothetical protein ACTSQO_09095 [Candidatus Helarchaeota archaeon]